MIDERGIVHEVPQSEARRPQAEVDFLAVSEPKRVLVEEPAQIECFARDVHAEPDARDDFGEHLD